MRFVAIVVLSITTAALHNSKYTEAFQPTVPNRASKARWVKLSMIGNGWDNDNFLESLGQGGSAMADANDEYYKQSSQNEELRRWKEDLQARQLEEEEKRRQENTIGAKGGYAASPEDIMNLELDQLQRKVKANEDNNPAVEKTQSPEEVDRMKRQVKANEDNPTGGSKFQLLMQRAKQTPQATAPYPPPMPPQHQTLDTYASQQQQQQYQPPPLQLFDQYGNPVTFPPQPQFYDQNGNPIYLQPPQQPPQPQQQQLQPPQYSALPSPPPPTPNDRRVGRNKDADAIANSADVYFAQLKRDSTIRTTARIAGDVETANQAMVHPDIEKMKHLIQKNPYLDAERAEKQREEEIAYQRFMNMLGTSEDEELPSGGEQHTKPATAPMPEPQTEEERIRQENMGNYQSFKDRLRAAQAKKNAGY